MRVRVRLITHQQCYFNFNKDNMGRNKGENSMKRVRVMTKKWNVEIVLIKTGMMVMEVFGMVMLYCGVMNIRII